jgi:hypothetical protein
MQVRLTTIIPQYVCWLRGTCHHCTGQRFSFIWLDAWQIDLSSHTMKIACPWTTETGYSHWTGHLIHNICVKCTEKQANAGHPDNTSLHSSQHVCYIYKQPACILHKNHRRLHNKYCEHFNQELYPWCWVLNDLYQYFVLIFFWIFNNLILHVRIILLPNKYLISHWIS